MPVAVIERRKAPGDDVSTLGYRVEDLFYAFGTATTVKDLEEHREIFEKNIVHYAPDPLTVYSIFVESYEVPDTEGVK